MVKVAPSQSMPTGRPNKERHKQIITKAHQQLTTIATSQPAHVVKKMTQKSFHSCVATLAMYVLDQSQDCPRREIAIVLIAPSLTNTHITFFSKILEAKELYAVPTTIV